MRVPTRRDCTARVFILRWKAPKPASRVASCRSIATRRAASRRDSPTAKAVGVEGVEQVRAEEKLNAHRIVVQGDFVEITIVERNVLVFDLPVHGRFLVGEAVPSRVEVVVLGLGGGFDFDFV